jgi:Zn-dependent protease with chaperone function
MNSSIFGAKMRQSQSTVSRQLLLCMSIISILAAIGCVAADLILQYDPQGNYSFTTPAPLTIALWRILVGSFLGVFCIPLEIAGYWVVCRAFWFTRTTEKACDTGAARLLRDGRKNGASEKPHWTPGANPSKQGRLH